MDDLLQRIKSLDLFPMSLLFLQTMLFVPLLVLKHFSLTASVLVALGIFLLEILILVVATAITDIQIEKQNKERDRNEI